MLDSQRFTANSRVGTYTPSAGRRFFIIPRLINTVDGTARRVSRVCFDEATRCYPYLYGPPKLAGRRKPVRDYRRVNVACRRLLPYENRAAAKPVSKAGGAFTYVVIAHPGESSRTPVGSITIS